MELHPDKQEEEGVDKEKRRKRRWKRVRKRLCHSPSIITYTCRGQLGQRPPDHLGPAQPPAPSTPHEFHNVSSTGNIAYWRY